MDGWANQCVRNNAASGVLLFVTTGSHGFDIRGPNVALHVGEPHLASLHALHAILEEKMSSFGEGV